MSFFPSASGVCISGGDFTNIGGDQKNHNVYKVNVQLSRRTKKQKPRIFDEYVRIPTGKTQLLDLVFESTPKFESDGVEIETKESPVRRAAHVVRIAGERNGGFLRVSYTGPGAQQAFKRDFLKFARVKSLEVAQLYGYSNSEALPALIFYDALVPVNTIRSHHKFSALLDLYMSSRWRRMVDSSEQGPQIMKTFDFTRELWIQPRSGGLCIGPLGPDCYPSIMYPRKNSVVNGPTLAMELYEDANLLQYHGQYLSDREFLLALSILSLELNPLLPEAEADILTLPGSIYSIVREQTIATCPKFRMSWHLAPRDSSQLWSNGVETERFDNNTLRLTFTSWKDIEALDLCVTCVCTQPDSEQFIEWPLYWLSQAHSIYAKLCISEESSKPHVIMFGGAISLFLRPPQLQDLSFDEIKTPFYLFVHPLPLDSSQVPDLEAWMRGDMYYWSFDPTGRNSLPKDGHPFPELVPSYEVWYKYWERRIYDAIHQWQVYKGFDPSTTDFARSLGFPILQILGDDSRFQEVEVSDLGRDGDWELEMTLRGF